jgi:hypothetical protein
LITGAIFGLGIFLTRAAVERFHTSRLLPRLVAGILAGALLMNLALFVFHVLFLRTPPHGFLIAAGCFVIALAFAAASFTPSYPLRALLVSLVVFGVILAGWWIHIRFASAPEQLTPLLRYDYAWSLAQVAMTALAVSLPIGILGNLVDLTLKPQDD